MLYKCYLKKHSVYLPTTVNQGVAVYMDVDPVTVVPVMDTEQLRQAMQDTIPEENPFRAPTVEDARKPPVILKYTGDKSWSAFMRGASSWSIYKKDGIFQIRPYHVHSKGYWEVDRDQTLKFPRGTNLDEVVDRMIAVLQDAAQK
ncbi:MAG: hypothetical protein WBB34_01855 [Xanthobacteraceae bacterium]